MAVALVGAHRSGTSMITRMLHLAGLQLGDASDLIPATADNPEGFWENRRFIEINDELLNQIGAGWDYPGRLCGEWDTHEVAHLRRKAELLLRSFDGEQPWGWKDPRTSLTLPFWQSLLPELKVVVCVRNPLEVALSLGRRNGYSLALTLNLWYSYNRAILDATLPERRLVTHYLACSLRPAHEVGRLLQFLGMDATPNQIEGAATTVRPDLYHHRLTGWDLITGELDAEVVRLYVDLCREAGCLDLVSVDPLGKAGQTVTSDQRARAREVAYALTPAPHRPFGGADQLDGWAIQATGGLGTSIGKVNRAQLEAELQRRHAAALQAQVDNLSAELAAQEAMTSDLEARNVLLGTQNDQLGQSLDEREAAVAELRGILVETQAAQASLTEAMAAESTRRQELEVRLAEQQHDLVSGAERQANLRAQIAERDGALAGQRVDREALEIRLARREDDLAEVYASTAWQVVVVLWRVRTLLIPPGSKRDRALWRVICGFRAVLTVAR